MCGGSWMDGWGWWTNENINHKQISKVQGTTILKLEVGCCLKFICSDRKLGEVAENFQKSSKDDSKCCDIFRVC